MSQTVFIRPFMKCAIYNPDKNIFKKIKKSNKMEQVQNLDVCFCVLGCVSTMFWDFSNISWLPKFLNLKLVGNFLEPFYIRYDISFYLRRIKLVQRKLDVQN